MIFDNVQIEVTEFKGFIEVLVEDEEGTGAWVCCSSLEAFAKVLKEAKENYGTIKAISTEDGILQWNRGHLFCITELMKEFADLHQVELHFICGTHPFLDEELEYQTVHLEGEDTKFHRTGKCSYQVL